MHGELVSQVLLYETLGLFLLSRQATLPGARRKGLKMFADLCTQSSRSKLLKGLNLIITDTLLRFNLCYGS